MCITRGGHCVSPSTLWSTPCVAFYVAVRDQPQRSLCKLTCWRGPTQCTEVAAYVLGGCDVWVVATVRLRSPSVPRSRLDAIMGKKCFVPNCRSGYQSCPDQVPLFKAPSEPARLELWRRGRGAAVARASGRVSRRLSRKCLFPQ